MSKEEEGSHFRVLISLLFVVFGKVLFGNNAFFSVSIPNAVSHIEQLNLCNNGTYKPIVTEDFHLIVKSVSVSGYNFQSNFLNYLTVANNDFITKMGTNL